MNLNPPHGSTQPGSGLRINSNRAAGESLTSIGQPVSDIQVEPAVWDFKLVSSAGYPTEFSFSKRVQTEPAFRLIGQHQNTASTFKTFNPGPTLPRQYQAQSRPNRFHSGVLMVAGDLGPAPWDEDSTSDLTRLPVLGEVAAGRYDVTVAYHDPGYGDQAEPVLVNTAQIKVNRQTFALRVRGQSMIENEIDDGDIIIVQAQDWADDGDFVIACLTDSSDEAGFITLKRFYRHRQAGRVVLQPANKSLNPIHLLPRQGDAADDLDSVKIQGRVTAIIKTGGLLD